MATMKNHQKGGTEPKGDEALKQTTTTEPKREPETPEVAAAKNTQEAPLKEEAQELPQPEVESIATATQIQEPVIQSAPEEETVSKVTIAVVGLENFSEELRNKIESLVANGSPVARISILGLVDFTRVMHPGERVALQAGGQAHRNLLAMLRNVTNSGCDDFDEFFSTALDLINESSKAGAFSQTRLMTYSENADFEPSELQAYGALLNTLIVLSQKTDRKAVIAAEDVSYLGEEGAARVIAFAA